MMGLLGLVDLILRVLLSIWELVETDFLDSRLIFQTVLLLIQHILDFLLQLVNPQECLYRFTVSQQTMPLK